MSRRKSRRPRGHGCVYKRGTRNFWVKYQDPEGGFRYQGGYGSEEEARRELAQRLGDLAAGRPLPPDPKKQQTLAALAEEWLERRKGTHRSAADDAGRWRLHLRPQFGACKPSQVDHAAIRSFVEDKLKKLAPNSVGNCVRLLSTFYSDLVERNSSYCSWESMETALTSLVRKSRTALKTRFRSLCRSAGALARL